MIWTAEKQYFPFPFATEAQLEDAILEVQASLFGRMRFYVDAKKKIGNGKTKNIPVGYLIDLSSAKDPRLFVVENELGSHEPLRHIAVQILEFSLSFETSQHKVKTVLRQALAATPEIFKQCSEYARKHGFENIDYLLETLIFRQKFGALVIIDELDDELEKVLVSRFKFPVEILTLSRYRSADNEIAYDFEPFLAGVQVPEDAKPGEIDDTSHVDISDIDTIVVPAHEDGFNETALGENRWYAIRIHSSMIPKIRHIAFYLARPTSSITHVATVATIETWKDTNKYVVTFEKPATAIGPIKLVPNGKVKALQNIRYTPFDKLSAAKDLDGVF